MSLALGPLARFRSNKRGRSKHYQQPNCFKKSPHGQSKLSTQTQSVIRCVKKKQRAKIDKLGRRNACWTRLRLMKLKKKRKNKIEAHLNKMKFRVLSERYLRKLSISTCEQSQIGTKTISWASEIEVLYFKKTDSPDSIEPDQAHLVDFKQGF